MIVTEAEIALFKNRCIQRVITLGIEQAEKENRKSKSSDLVRKNRLTLLYNALVFIDNPDARYTDTQQEDIINYVSAKCDLLCLGTVDFFGLDTIQFADPCGNGQSGGGNGITLPIMANQVNVMVDGAVTDLQLTVNDIYRRIGEVTLDGIDGGTTNTNF